MDLALFDFDSTITTRDTFADFIRFSAPRLRLYLGGPVLAPIVWGFRRGWVSGHQLRACAVYAGLRGMPLAQAQAHGERFAASVLPALESPATLERIAWHRERGDRLLVVSGALALYLAPWCRRHGLAWLCSELEVRDGRLTGRYRGEQCVADEKRRRVLAALDPARFGAVHAYGDSPDDHAMLRMADHAYYRGHPWTDDHVSQA